MAIGIGKPAPKSEGAPKAGSEDMLSAFGEYADDVFAAIKSGDKAAFKSALKSAIQACYEDEE